MAKTYAPLNGVMKSMLRRGFGPPGIWLLTLRGRRSGRSYSTPVSPVERDGKRYIVSPYGEQAWAKNARAAGEVSLGRGKRLAAYRIEPVLPAEAVPVLKQYLVENKITRPYFDTTADSSDEAWLAEAPRHPVVQAPGEVATPSGWSRAGRRRRSSPPPASCGRS